ncbi:MAG TPA: hypothetical protein VGK48_22520 [Terriglobia bacterium]|jgi:hypothetical protein
MVEDEQPKLKRRAPRKPARTAAVGKVKTAASVDNPAFLEDVVRRLEGRQSDKNIVLNVPIWGWTGDGKTCSLLTAIHYCDPAQHPLGLALITNTDELTKLENSAEEYRGLNLTATAVGTTVRLRDLSEKFVDDCEWPPGTDEPSAYILAIRSISGTLGYVLFPDIKGGSFRELDETARDILSKAHAILLLVNPELYVQQTTDGKRYRDEILARLQEFAEAEVPVCIMITKADRYQGPNDGADTAYNQLTIVVERQKNLKALLCRVSVIGIGVPMEDDKLPLASARKPETLLRAWIWLLAEALHRTSMEIRKVVPSVSFRTNGEGATLSVRTIPELRQLGHFSGSPGRVLCATNDDARSVAFTFVSEKGELLETSLESTAIQEPKFKAAGAIPGWAHIDLLAHYVGGEFVLGARAKCNFVWQGTKGTHLKKISLPYEMVSWTPITGRRIIGVDASGRLHSLHYEGEKWLQADYIEGFLKPSSVLTCAFSERSSHAFVFNGDAVEGVVVAADGKLGNRVAPDLMAKFDTTDTMTNRLGLCLSISSDDQARISASGKPLELGPVYPDEAKAACALAPYSALLALINPDLRLSAAAIVGSKIIKTSPENSPLLDAAPQTMVWANSGELLAVSFADKTWRLFRPMGLGS